VPAREPLVGERVVAEPSSIDALAALGTNVTIVRFAPDEALVLGARVQLDEPAIVEEEVGYVALTVERELLERHVEWPLPAVGATGQGKVAGVPAKVVWLPDGRAWVIAHAAYASELEERLGWR
jgi:hypothetical protein